MPASNCHRRQNIASRAMPLQVADYWIWVISFYNCPKQTSCDWVCVNDHRWSWLLRTLIRHAHVNNDNFPVNIIISAKWTEWNWQIYCVTWISVRPSVCPSVSTQYLDANISKTVWVRDLYKLPTNRKWLMADRMMTLSMTSRVLQRSRSWSQYL